MKSYYGMGQDSSSVSSGSKARTNNILESILEERRNPKVSEDVKEANANLTSGISTLKNSVAALQNDNTYTNTQTNQNGQTGQNATDKVVSAMKNFVSQYNDVVNAAKHSTLSNKTAYIANMMKTSKANEDKLAEIGVTINLNGTLQFNEGKMKATGISKVQELFSSKDAMSYGSTVMSRLQFAGIGSTTDATDKDNTARFQRSRSQSRQRSACV